MHTHRCIRTLAALALGALVATGCADRPQPAHVSTAAPAAPEVAQAAPEPTTPAPAPTTPTTEPAPALTVPPRPQWTIPATTTPTTVSTTVASVTVDGLPRTLRRIGGCESTGNPDGPLLWTQPNLQGSTASGAFQILDSTWRRWRVTYGAGTDAASYSRAMHAPAPTQVTVALGAYRAEGTGPWVSSSGCWAG